MDSLSGIATTGYSGLGTNTLTWSIDPIGIGRFATALAGSGIHALTDAAGNPLAGRRGLLAGLQRPLWRLDRRRLRHQRRHAGRLPGRQRGAYSVFDDLDGNGTVNLTDVQIARLQNGASLPAVQPGTSGATQVADGSLLFGGIYSQTDTCTVPDGMQATGITLLSHAGATVVKGTALTLSGDIVDASPEQQTINLPLVLIGGSHTVDSSAGNLTLAGPIGQSGGPNSVVVTGPGTVTLLRHEFIHRRHGGLVGHAHRHQFRMRCPMGQTWSSAQVRPPPLRRQTCLSRPRPCRAARRATAQAAASSSATPAANTASTATSDAQPAPAPAAAAALSSASIAVPPPMIIDANDAKRRIFASIGSRTGPVPPPPAVNARVAQRSAGNPFALAASAGSWWENDPLRSKDRALEAWDAALAEYRS